MISSAATRIPVLLYGIIAIVIATSTVISAPRVEVRSVGLTTQDVHTSSKKSTFHQSAKGRGSAETRVASTSFSGPATVRADVLGIDAKRRDRLPEVKVGAFSEGATPRIAVSRVADQTQNIRWHKSGLSPAAGAVVSTLAGAATALAGGFGASAGVFSAKAVAITAAEGLATSAAGRGAVALANNNFRLDKAAREVVAPGSARAILKTALSSAGVHGITGATGLGTPAAGMDFGARTAATLERFAVKSAVDGAVYGQGLSEVAGSAASGGLLAIAQSSVGDVAAMTGLANGSITKAALHAAVGGIYSGALTGHATAGAIGGAVAELLSPYVSSGPATSALLAASAGAALLLAGGDERAVTVAGVVAASEYEYNGILHPSPDDETERQKQEQLERAGEHTVAGAKKSAKWAAEHPDEAMQLAEHALTAAQMVPGPVGAGARVTSAVISAGKGARTLAAKLRGEPAAAEVLSNASSFSGKTIEHMATAEVAGFATTGRTREIVPARGRVVQPTAAAAPVPVTAVAAPASAQPVHFEQAAKQLLPGEGRVGTYGELDRLRKVGDNLTPHHIPSNAYMNQFGVTRGAGIAIMVEQPTPGIGGRHRKTATYARKPNLETAPRTELAKDIIDLRSIYRDDGLLTPQINDSLRGVIEQNKLKFPSVFNKANVKQSR